MMHVRPTGYTLDWRRGCHHETVLVTGDGGCLPDDVQRFEAFGIPHDLFCVNRSLLYFQRPVQHWAAVDAEESAWYSQYVPAATESRGHIIRHTIGTCPVGYDVFWGIVDDLENENQKSIWAGNSGYFAVLASLHMGYRRVVLGGMPLDRSAHWYEPEDDVGPNWVGACYTQWMDFKMQHPEAHRVRSLSGYSAFILGTADREWIADA